jgi:ParB-like chromosome segregation protein Spo0J
MPAPTIENHPIADAFPLLTSEELYALRDNIQSHGLKQSIVLFEEKILDGRNRYRACLAAKVTPRFENYQGNDPVGFVIGLNINRRHLDASQRAMIAADLENMRHGGKRQTEQDANLHLDPQGKKQAAETTRAQVAEKLGVSTRSVAEAVAVKKTGVLELQTAVRQGKASVSAAAAVAKLPAEAQRAAVAGGRKAVTAAAKNGTSGDAAPSAKPPEVTNALARLGRALSPETMAAIDRGTIKISDAELIELSAKSDGVIPQAINLMHSRGRPLKWAMRVIEQPVDEQSRVEELLNLCIRSGGYWSGLFNLDAFRITVERHNPDALQR